MIGANQLSERNLGYEIIKKDLTIFSPRFSSFGLILKAEGAIISCNSKTPAS